MLKNIIKGAPGMTSKWPPTAHNIRNESVQTFVPYQLFNLIAVCIGAAEEPSLTSYANVDDDMCNKILSISQDIIYLASKVKNRLQSLFHSV